MSEPVGEPLVHTISGVVDAAMRVCARHIEADVRRALQAKLPARWHWLIDRPRLLRWFLKVQPKYAVEIRYFRDGRWDVV